jgi:hypothetical protein
MSCLARLVGLLLCLDTKLWQAQELVNGRPLITFLISGMRST